MDKQKNIAIIFAGGVGQRFGAQLPKQFVVAHGKPIIIHTLEVFENNPEIDEIYVGIVEEWLPFFKALVERYGISKIPENGILPGGESGQDTIYRILKRAAENNDRESIVLIHDGVRPIVTAREISQNIENVKKYGSAVTCIPFTETPVYSPDGEFVNATLERKHMFRGVAPQSFRLGHIINAHEKIRENDPNYEGEYDGFKIVDSASLVKAAYDEKCSIVEGNPNNMKVTGPDDFSKFCAVKAWSDYENFFNAQNDQSFVPNASMVEAQRLAELRAQAEAEEEKKNETKSKVMILTRSNKA